MKKIMLNSIIGLGLVLNFVGCGENSDNIKKGTSVQDPSSTKKSSESEIIQTEKDKTIRDNVLKIINTHRLGTVEWLGEVLGPSENPLTYDKTFSKIIQKHIDIKNENENINDKIVAYDQIIHLTRNDKTFINNLKDDLAENGIVINNDTTFLSGLNYGDKTDVEKEIIASVNYHKVKNGICGVSDIIHFTHNIEIIKDDKKDKGFWIICTEEQ